MAPNFSKNAILKGDIDFFCLVCEAYIKSTTECEAHISTEQHERNFDTTNYVKEFPGDFIRKIKTKYFCEVCNKILSVLARVRLHVNESTHIEKKNTGWLKRFANVVIAFDTVAIDDYTWHGLCENSCAICNTECDDYDEHKILPTHIINLLQTRVEFDKNRNIFRKIDEYSFQCLTCNLVHTLSTIKNHFDSQSHRELYQVCLDACKPLKEDMQRLHKLKSHLKPNDSMPKNLNNINNSILNKKEENNAVETKGLAASETNLNVDGPANNENKNINTNNNPDPPKSNESKVKPKRESTYKFDEDWEKRTCKVLGANDYVTRDENNQPWCILCDWIMDISKVREHLNGRHHQSLLKLHKKRAEKLKLRNLNIINEEINAKINNIKVINAIEYFQKNDINIQSEMKTVYCKKCSIKLDYDYDVIDKHIHDHKKPTSEDVQTGQNSYILQVALNKCFGENLITTPQVINDRESELENTDGNSKDIVKTEEEVKTNTDVFSKEETQNEEHIGDGSLNQTKKFKYMLDKMSTKDYIENVMAVKNIVYRDLVINEKICINVFSFLFMILLLDKVTIKCYACDENVLYRNFREHCAKEKHELAVKEVPVLAHLDTEFIREIRPGYFHCGFCNTCESSWEDMELHLTSIDHKECKNDASWRLQKYQPEIANGKYERTVADVLYANVINGNFF